MIQPALIEAVLEITAGGSQTELFRVAHDADYLQRLLEDMFHNHWRDIVFGPILPGAAFEIRCPCAPRSIALSDGYLTVHFGATHFHLCIGPGVAAPTPETQRRLPGRAEFVRYIDQAGAPSSWGFQMFNAEGTPTINIFFPNPFLSDDDGIRSTPDWSRLAMWDELALRYLGREPSAYDRSGKGFV